MDFDFAAHQKKIEDLTSQAKSEALFTHCSYATGFLDADLNCFDLDSSLESAKTVFDLSSLTKALFCTPLVLKQAWAAGKQSDCYLSEIFPDHCFFQLETAKNLRLSDVLRHEAGLVFWKNFFVECDGFKRSKLKILSEALASINPKPKNLYSDIGPILLGHLLELSSASSLAEIWRQFCDKDLGSNEDLFPRPSWKFSSEDCAGTGFCAVRGRDLCGEVHDENAWALGGFSTHSGPFGNLHQTKNLLKAMNNSVLGKRVIKENFIWAQAHRDSDSALGWRTGRDQVSVQFGRGDSIGHYGFTGTAFWINPKDNSFVILLTNRVAKGRTSNMNDMKEFRSKMFSLFQEYIDARKRAYFSEISK